MGAIVEPNRPLFLQAEIGLVHQGGALQGVVGSLPAHVVTGEAPKFLINQRQNRMQGFVVAGVPLRQQQIDRLGRKG